MEVKMLTKSVSFIIPAYNEEKRILKTLMEITEFFNTFKYEIIVATDGCTDKTVAIVKGLNDKNIKVIENKKRMGKGAALFSGISLCSYNIVVIIDADNSTSLHSVNLLIDLVSKYFDGAIGSRYVNGSLIDVKQSLFRKILSRGFNLLVRILFKLNYCDTQCGCKVIRRDIISELHSNISKGFAFDVEMLWRLNQMGCYIPEIPVIWSHDDGSSVNLKRDVIKMFYEIIKLRIITMKVR